MRWVLIIGLGLVALIAVIAIVGALLPRDHVVTLRARIAATPDAVWETITTPTAFPSWRSDLQKVEMLAPGEKGPSWREHFPPWRDHDGRRCLGAAAPSHRPNRRQGPSLWRTVGLSHRARRRRREPSDDHGARLGLQSGLPVRFQIHHGTHRYTRRIPSRPRPKIRRRADASRRRREHGRARWVMRPSAASASTIDWGRSAKPTRRRCCSRSTS